MLFQGIKHKLPSMENCKSLPCNIAAGQVHAALVDTSKHSTLSLHGHILYSILTNVYPENIVCLQIMLSVSVPKKKKHTHTPLFMPEAGCYLVKQWYRKQHLIICTDALLCSLVGCLQTEHNCLGSLNLHVQAELGSILSTATIWNGKWRKILKSVGLLLVRWVIKWFPQ